MRKQKVRNGKPSPGLFHWKAVISMPYRKVGTLEACWYMIRFKLKEVFGVPRFPDHPCSHPGCPRLVPSGRKYCDEHQALHPEEIRSASARGYGRRWQKASKAFLHRNPLCVQCAKQGRYVKATVVDHVIPHRGDPVLFWDQNNWQALCKPCHDKKTGMEDSRPSYRY